jgi:serine/threonine protein kinase
MDQHTTSDDAAPDGAPTGAYATGGHASGGSASELLNLLDRYLADLQAGRSPDKKKLLADHPDLAAELEQCLAGMDFVHRAAKPQAGAPAQLGDFRIVREVGRGGMGVVYEAEQVSLKRKVALKVLRFGIGADAEVMERFQREAETVAHLHHTNIVPIHAVGCEEGVHYYAMQFIEGRSLAEVIEAGRATPERETASHFRQMGQWGLQAAEALAHAHQRGVIHRDIKPSNLILDPDGTVWLTDFGLAKRADEVTLTAAGVLMGTPRYMSPEQAAAAKQPIDHRTDIYSLGATLYELATGKPVFEAQTPQGVITQILNAEPVAPRLLQGGLPRDLETIILKCLAKDPARRYQQARDLADDLRASLENRAIKARRASLAERAGRWVKKHRRSTIVSAVTAAASLLLIVVGFNAWRSYQDSLLARLSLTTDGPSRVAEVLDENGNLVVPSFPVPTPQPVVLPAGNYRLRFTGPGMLSEDWHIQLERQQHAAYPVNLLDRQLWPPFDVAGSDPPPLVSLNGQPHLLVGDNQGWRLRHGATGRDVWTLKLPEKPPASNYPDKFIAKEWGGLLKLPESYEDRQLATGESPGLALPAADLDGDGRHDLVFASRHSPSLLAVSGKDGKVLWWFRAAPNVPRDHDAAADPFVLENSRERAAVLGEPVLVDVAGAPAIIGAFVSFEYAYFETKAGKRFSPTRQYWLEAVAARTGKSLWRTPLTVDVPRMSDGGDPFKRFPNRPEIVVLDGRRALLLSVHSTLSAFDVETGKELWPRYDLGDYLVQAPRIADLDGDGQPDALFAHAKYDQSNAVSLRAVSLKTRGTLWERPISLPFERNPNRATDVAWVTSPDGSGKVQVIVPTKDDWNAWANHWFGVEALDGATGELRWQRRSWSVGTFRGSGGDGSVTLVEGPDLDGDGHRELFVAAVGSRAFVEMKQLRIEALSGKDGRPLWRRQFKDTEIPGRMQWWQAGADGWPMLVAPIATGPGGQPITYALAASTGQVEHKLSEVGEVHVADINGDGMADLYHLSAALGSRRFVVFRGLPPTVWRRPGNWRPAKDYDGDGASDFLDMQRDGITARSGRDGRKLWQVKTPSVLGPLHVDVDGDGVHDVVVVERTSEAWPNGDGVFAAYSGKDGRRLWTGPDIGLKASHGSFGTHFGPRTDYRYPLLDLVDLDGDGRPELLVAGTNYTDVTPESRGKNQGLCLTAVSSKDGSMLWRVPILQRAFTGRSLIDRHLFHDLNGDGVRDFVVWAPEKLIDNLNAEPDGAVLRAYSGRDGKPLWPDGSPGRFKQGRFLGGAAHGPFAWPRTALADLDGDGRPSVVLTTFDSEAADGKRLPCELLVLDGREGSKRWGRPWNMVSQWSELHLWPPLLIDAGGGKRTIALGELWSDAKESAKVELFDAQGNVTDALPTKSIYRGDTAWCAFDVDGDGQEELLYPSAKGLCAYRIHDKKTLWMWGAGFFAYPQSHSGSDAYLGHGSFGPGTGFAVAVEDLQRSEKGQPAPLIVRAGRDRGQTAQTAYYGLNAASGAARWRCDIPRHDKRPHIFESAVFYPESDSDVPLLVTHHEGSMHTVAQSPLPADAEGFYLPPKGQPVSFKEFADPDKFRPLPWATDPWHLMPRWWIREPPNPDGPSAGPPADRDSIPGIIVSHLFVVFLCTVVYLSWRGAWRRLLFYVILAVVVSAGIGAVMLWVDAGRFELGQVYSWSRWYWVLYQGADVLGGLTLVGAFVRLLVIEVRRRRAS